MAVVILAVFCFGCAAALAYMSIDIAMDFGAFGRILTASIAGPVCLIFIAIPFAFMDYEKSPDLVTLKKAEWECKSSHTVTTMILAGKVLIPSTSEICDQYGRKP